MNLDYSLFPDITKGGIFWQLPGDDLKQDPEVWNRAVGALYMLFKLQDESHQDGVTQQINAEVHLRSALVEFVGIEELLQNKGYNFKIDSLANPIFHIMRLLRNYQVHFSQLDMKNIKVDVVFMEEERTWDTLIIDNLETEKLCELRAVRKYKTYSPKQIEKKVAVFNEQQNRFGVYELLKDGMHFYLKVVGKVITRQGNQEVR